MTESGMFLYPWDMASDPEGFLRKYIGLGCDCVVLNCAYHHCSILDTSLRHVYENRDAGTSFAFHAERYGRIRPHLQKDFTQQIAMFRELCSQNRIRFKVWVVNSHNTTVGEEHPEACVQNVWGDVYSYSLCLNHPDVQEYLCALTEDVIQTAAPESMVMEAVTWLPAFHGRHHEFALARVTPAIRYLLSLCFCGHCMKKAEARGIDAAKVKQTVSGLLDALLKGDTTFGKNEQTQLMNIFLEFPDLYAYQQMRMDSVRDLVGRTSERAHALGVKYEMISLSTPFEVNSTCYEGTSYGKLAPLVDVFVPLVYQPEERFHAVQANIRMFAPDAAVAMGINLGRERYSGAEDFIGRIADAAQAGASSVYYYNYGMATEECRSWVKRANELLK